MPHLRKDRGLYRTRPGVSRLQVYLPDAVARQLVALADQENKSASRVAAEMVEEFLGAYEAGLRAVGAPAAVRSQRRIA